MATPNLLRSIQAFQLVLDTHILASIKSNQNIVVSPFAIHLALSLVLVGATGQTAKEICKALSLVNAESLATVNEYEKLLTTFANVLYIANKLYVKESFRVKPAFDTIATKQLCSQTQAVNFANAAETAKLINDWVRTQTNERIHQVVAPNDLDPSSTAVLVNAIYFKSGWRYPFDTNTRKKPFYNSNKESVAIDMMHLEECIAMADLKDLDASAISLEYKKGGMSMVILLPKKLKGLDALNAKLKKANLPQLLGQIVNKQTVDISLPKFKVEFEINLKDVLNQMGMRSMFNRKTADLSGVLVETDRLFVDKIVHKAYIEVNQTGTEGGAANAVQVVFYSSARVSKDPCVFIADHPFRFFVRNTANVVLFDGCFRHADGVTVTPKS